MKAKTTFALVFCKIILCVSAFGDTGVIKIDQVRCSGYEPYSFTPGGNVRFIIRFTNDTGGRVSIMNDLMIKSPDGAQYSHVTIDTTVNATWHSLFATYFDQMFMVIDDNQYPVGAAKVSVLGSASSSGGLPNGFDDTVLAITVWDLPVTPNIFKHICLDTAAVYPYETAWKWFSASLVEIHPIFTGIDGAQPYLPGYGYCFVATAPCEPPLKTATTSPQVGCGCSRCCEGTTGDVNRTSEIDLSDLSILIAYLVQTPRPALGCQEEANVDDRGAIDISDLSRLIAYLSANPRPALPPCP